MKRIADKRIRVICFVVVAVMVAGLGPLGARQVGAQGAKRVINGIEVSGRFLDVWASRGSDERSVYVNGLPISEARAEKSLEDGKSYLTQWFERARYEMHPENTRPSDVLLGRLGAWDAEGRGKIDPATGKADSPSDEPFVRVVQPPDADGKTRLWFPETGHTLSSKLLEYWSRYGGLSQFGFPLSEPFTETSRADGKRYTVQYFERARMELHPEKPAPYEVELGLLGVEQRSMRAVPGEELPVAPPKGVESRGDFIRAASSQEPENLTFAADTPIAYRVRSLIEDGLIGRDDNDNLFPLNAWYVPTLENGGARFVGEGVDRHLVVKYRLRQSIKWSDGKDLTSNDAVFAYRLLLHSESPTPSWLRSENLRLQSVDNPGKHTVLYKYRSLRQAETFYSGLPNKEDYTYLRVFIEQKKPVISHRYSEIGSILPEHSLGKIPPAQIADSPFGRAPIGTGPWRVQEWPRHGSMILISNEHYSLTAKPLIQKLQVFFSFDFNTGWSHIRTGNIQIATSESLVSMPYDIPSLNAGGMRVVSRPAVTWEHMDFFFGFAPFKEKDVREAITRAINRQRIVDVAYRGAGRVMNGVIPSSVYFSMEHPDFVRNYPDIAAKYQLPTYAYDPERAALLLEGAGWRCPPGVSNLRSCDNKPREKGGVKLSFEYGTTINAVRQNIQGLVVADLRAVGVDAQQKAYPASVFLGEPGPRTDGTTKLSQFSSVTSRYDDLSLYRCPDYFRRCQNTGAGYCGPIPICSNAFDEAVDKFTAEIDLNRQVAQAAEAQVAVMQDINLIPLVQRANIEIVTERLANYKLPNSTTSSFWNARQWYFR